MDDRPEVWACEEGPEDDFQEANEKGGENQNRTVAAITVFIHLLFAWQMTFTVSDNSVQILLNIIGYFLTMLQFCLQGDRFNNVLEMFPDTLFKARKYVGFDKDEFFKFVVCPKCTRLFTYDQAYVTENGIRKTNKCDFVEYPNHPQLRFRGPCGAALMKTVVSADGRKTSLYPHKIYCYQSLKISLQRLIERKEIYTALKRKIEKHDTCYYDVYDGATWHNFTDSLGEPYFSDKRNLAGMFNIDWFQPFEGSDHSIGALYMVLVNLPREIRFKRENVILIGIIPGPKEPALNVNSFFKPLVNKLLAFWKGVSLFEKNQLQLYRFVLLCISSDLPATRKCCGFLSYNAKKGI